MSPDKISKANSETAPSTAETRRGTGALEKGLILLSHICDRESPPRYSDLLKETALPKATLHRMLAALAAHGLITPHPDQTYRIGVRALGMAQKAWESMDVRSAAEQALRRLADATGETVHLAVLDETEVVYIDKVESRQRIRMFSAIGKRGPLHCTGVGKAMAAFLKPEHIARLLPLLPMKGFTESTITDRDAFLRHMEEIRRRGYAQDLEEHEAGIRCAAAPIFDYREEVVASISVTAPSLRLTLERLDEFAPAVVEAAREITSKLGGAMRPR